MIDPVDGQWQWPQAQLKPSYCDQYWTVSDIEPVIIEDGRLTASVLLTQLTIIIISVTQY